MLDDLFEVSVRLEGKAAAYKWIVAAHIHKHGWSDHWSTKAAKARLKTFARHYPTHWRQFVFDTSVPNSRLGDERLSIPHHRLVELLVNIGEIDTASEIADEMVSSFLLEVSEQPLRIPDWLDTSQ